VIRRRFVSLAIAAAPLVAPLPSPGDSPSRSAEKGRAPRGEMSRPRRRPYHRGSKTASDPPASTASVMSGAAEETVNMITRASGATVE